MCTCRIMYISMIGVELGNEALSETFTVFSGQLLNDSIGHFGSYKTM